MYAAMLPKWTHGRDEEETLALLLCCRGSTCTVMASGCAEERQALGEAAQWTAAVGTHRHSDNSTGWREEYTWRGKIHKFPEIHFKRNVRWDEKVTLLLNSDSLRNLRFDGWVSPRGDVTHKYYLYA